MSPTPLRTNVRRALALLAGGAVTLGLGIGVAPAASAAPPSQTIAGIIVDHSGAPVGGIDVSYDNFVCGSTLGELVDLTSPDDDDQVTTGPDGRFSFPSYHGQCYTVQIDAEYFSYQGKTVPIALIPSGTANVRITQLSETQSLTINTPQLPDGAEFSLFIATDFLGNPRWTHATSGLVSGGKAVVMVVPGQRYTSAFDRAGDVYPQFSGSGIEPPAVTDPGATFVTPADGGPVTTTPKLLTSKPIIVNLSGFDSGAEVSVTSLVNPSLALHAPQPDQTYTAGPVTFRGTAPGAVFIAAGGTSAGVNAYASTVVSAANGSSTITVNLSAGAAGTTLSSSNAVTTYTGSHKIGGTLTAHVTLEGDAVALPVTTTTYWSSSSSALLGLPLGSYDKVGSSYTFTPDKSDVFVLATFTVITSPGEIPLLSEGIAFVSMSYFLAAGGSPFPFPIGEVTPAPIPFPTTLPAISAAPIVGQRISVNTGSWSPAPTSMTYQWFRGATAIAGATASSYVPTAADAGKRLSAGLTIIDGNGGARTVTVNAAGSVAQATSKTVVKTKKKIKAKATKKAEKKAKKKGKKAKKVATAKIKINVKLAGVTPTGKTKVKVGKKTVTIKAKKLKNGKAKIKVKKLKRGTYVVTARYLGDAGVAASAWSKVKKIKVK